jgi:hypothetical protein
MASAVIFDKSPVKTKRIENSSFVVKTIKQKDIRLTTINQTLPFRIRFTAVKVPGTSPQNIPAIPLQIIGFSNYII